MTDLKIIPIKDTNRAINTQGPVESITNQFTTKEKTLNPSTNHGYEVRRQGYGSWFITTQHDDESIRIGSDQLMGESMI